MKRVNIGFPTKVKPRSLRLYHDLPRNRPLLLHFVEGNKIQFQQPLRDKSDQFMILAHIIHLPMVV